MTKLHIFIRKDTPLTQAQKDAIIFLKIVAAMDQTMSSFEQDQNVIFNNDKKVQIFKYNHLPNKRKLENIENKCYYPGCTLKPIKKSHTLQKSGPIKFLSEKGHVISPYGISKTPGAIAPIGIGDASTFPGFCENHEGVFTKFENTKEFKSENDIRLQLYRTICREISASKVFSAKLKHSKAYYIKFRNKSLYQQFEEKLSGMDLTLQDSGIKKQRTHLRDRYVLFCEKHLKKRRIYRWQLKKMAHAILNDIEKDKDETFFFFAIKVDIEIPVCLAGRGGMRFGDKSSIREFNFILNVIPGPGETLLVMGALNKHKEKVNWYMNHYKSNPFTLLAMVESWMLYASDHWFLSPSVWDLLSPETKKQVHEEIHQSRKNILAPPDVVIFKALRFQILREFIGYGSRI